MNKILFLPPLSMLFLIIYLFNLRQSKFMINIDRSCKTAQIKLLCAHTTRWFLVGSTHSFFSHSKGHVFPVPTSTVEIRELTSKWWEEQGSLVTAI